MQGPSSIGQVRRRAWMSGSVAFGSIVATVLFAFAGSLSSPANGPNDATGDVVIDDVVLAGDEVGEIDPLPPPQEGGVQQALLVSSFQCNPSAPGCQFINSVLKYDAATGAYLGVHISGIDGPTGMVKHPVTGRLLVASRNDDLVNEYDMHTGAFIRTFVAPASGNLNVPQSMIFHPNGNLLVTSTQTDGSLGATNGIIEYNGVTGEFVRVFIDGGFLGENCGDERCLYGPNTMAYSPDGTKLYVTSGNNDLILEFNATTGAYVNYFDAGSLVFPNGLIVRPNGAFRPNNLIVTSLYLNPANPGDSHKLLEFDDVTHELIATGSGVLSTGFSTPGPLMFATDGHILVGDRSFWFVPPNYSDRIPKRNNQTGAFIAYFTPTTNFNLHYNTGMLFVQIGCLSNADCNDANPCTDDVCNGGTNTCSNVNDDTNTPNDGLFCNGTEASCSNGQIVYSAPPPNCADALSCTTDSCNESTDLCVHTPDAGFCVITGACVVEGTINPGNTCQSCNTAVNANNWSNRPTGTQCGSTVDNECDNPDTCNASGVCLTNFAPNGAPCGVNTDTTCTNPDTCNGAGGCNDNNAPNGSQCNDGLFCTVNDTCSNGFCFGAGTPCGNPNLPICLEQGGSFLCVVCGSDEDCPEDGLFCTQSTCDLQSHTCDHVPDDTVCDDGLFCNGAETCNNITGACNAGGDPCAGDPGCDEQTDRCVECTTNAQCDDSLFCNGVESCAPPGQCRSGTLVVTNGSFNGQTGWTNNIPVHGSITYTGVLSVTGPNNMTGGFTWSSQNTINFQGGTLEFDLISYSNPGDTADWDYPVIRIGTTFYGLNSSGTLSGPTSGDNEGAGNIDNAHPATNVHYSIDVEVLVGAGAHNIGFGVCSVDGEFGGAVAVYDNVFGLAAPGSPCNDACNEALDLCIECTTNGECNDGLFCNGTETCQGGACVNGAAPCTANQICLEATDQCVQCVDNAGCNDGLFCNGQETCVSNVCVPGTTPCGKGQACNEGNDTCTGCGNNSQCDDGNVCNGQETCVSNQCVPGTPIPNCCTSNAQCTNNNVCDGVETCVAGICQAGSPLNCNDGRPCTTDSCSPTSGCQHSNLPSGSPCGDQTNTPCNLPDTCNPIGDCQANVRPNGTPCPDGIACNGNESCSTGVCQPGTPIPNCCENNGDCDNGNPCDGTEICVSQTCQPGTPVPNCCINNSDCSDGDVCDGIETCVSNSCVAGSPLNCNDGNSCTQDICHPVFGCQIINEPSGTTCGSQSDSACDNPDSCDGAGTCQPNLEPNGTGCTDGVVCNGNETCEAGVCKPGIPIPSCCQNNSECNNNNVCDGVETCVSNTCVAGVPLNCGDNNPCTDDVCNAATGCSNPNNNLSCDDGDECTGFDMCENGTCVGGGPAGCNGPGCTDCDNNGVRDDCEEMLDCDQNSIPDACEPIGDGDGDCDVDFHDLSAFQNCFRGDGVTAMPECFPFDIDNDGDVDLGDWGGVRSELTGP